MSGFPKIALSSSSSNNRHGQRALPDFTWHDQMSGTGLAARFHLSTHAATVQDLRHQQLKRKETPENDGVSGSHYFIVKEQMERHLKIDLTCVQLRLPLEKTGRAGWFPPAFLVFNLSKISAS
jgi:hypothetical protein